MPSLALIDVHTPSQVESLRIIRNECRRFMTRDTTFVSPGQQALWFGALDRAQMHPYLLAPDAAGEPLGYGLIRLDDNASLISGGLREKHWGQGIGMQLFALLIEKARELSDASVELEVLESNVRARRVYEKLGFTPLASRKGVLHMRLP